MSRRLALAGALAARRLSPVCSRAALVVPEPGASPKERGQIIWSAISRGRCAWMGTEYWAALPISAEVSSAMTRSFACITSLRRRITRERSRMAP